MVALPQIIGGSEIPGRLQPQGNYSAFTIVRSPKGKYLPALHPRVRMAKLLPMLQPAKNWYSFPAIRGAAENFSRGTLAV